MAALPDNGGPRTRSAPLGSLLAGRGHITEEQLELALTEQKVTGRPLGEIIVARGFAAAPTVAQALATQHGGLLKTEYGFATGWTGEGTSEPGESGVRAPEPPAHDETASLRASLAEHQKALEAWKQAHAQLEERLAHAQAESGASPVEDPRLAELEAERNALQAELVEARTPVPPVEDPRVAELEAERDALQAELVEARSPVPPVEDPRLAELEAERNALQAELVEARTPAPAVEDPRLAELEAERDALQAELVEARRPVPPVEDPRLAELEAERDALQAELVEARSPVPPVEDPRLAELEANCEALQIELAARAASIEQLDAKLASVEAGCTELEQTLAQEVERGASARAELAERQAAPSGRWAAAESHLVFFQGAAGYELHERSGPPPNEGSSVGTQIVARIGSAPIPGSKLPCAYLVA